MAKRDIEAELAELGAIRARGTSDATPAVLAKALRDRVNLIVAKAASVAADLRVSALIPELVTAYDRLFVNAAKSDPQCWGKSAAAKALKELGYAQAAPFLRGARHRQLEPVWGGEQDTAATLRGTCVLALVQCMDLPAQEILSWLVDACGDDAAAVRRDAVQGLEQWGSPEAVLLLRMKARLGDEDPAITGAALDALLRIEATNAVLFVASFLDSPREEIEEEAALALGSSKLEAAAGVLIERCRAGKIRKEIWIRALGTSRVPAALSYLLELIRSGRSQEAIAALRALEERRSSVEVRDQISAAVSDRSDEEVAGLFLHLFPRPDGE